MLMRLSLATFISLLLLNGAGSARVIEIQYDGFTVWVDCDRRGAVLFHYIAEADAGSLPRHSGYVLDSNVDLDCQSTSTDTFGAPYDVGHQVPANHFDGSEVAIRQTNYWTNLLPQTASMNRGAWLRTEYIIECIRDEVPLEVWGGPIWGNDASNDDFVDTHGMVTPDAFWKVVVRTDNRDSIAWIIPNAQAPGRSLDQWIVSVADVERLTSLDFAVADQDAKPETSWPRRTGCDVE